MARRRTRSVRRSFRRRLSFRRGHHSKPGIVSKITSGVALAIGFSPVIARAQEAMSGGGWQNFGNNLAYDYSAGLSSGHFDQAALVRAYGPLIGAVIFKKAAGYLLKIARIKL